MGMMIRLLRPLQTFLSKKDYWELFLTENGFTSDQTRIYRTLNSVLVAPENKVIVAVGTGWMSTASEDVGRSNSDKGFHCPNGLGRFSKNSLALVASGRNLSLTHPLDLDIKIVLGLSLSEWTQKYGGLIRICKSMHCRGLHCPNGHGGFSKNSLALPATGRNLSLTPTSFGYKNRLGVDSC
ncbi:hypothetical protein G4B88_016047 [Cannabis sativa]|uniref:Uncharacterized protein n=1 Tax=Cannabis sativa TaxID=3483 RepID=A0A7J6DIZ9_CANSA|nr:hypothetical protein G4B88_016047 [Cannabis sativa]